jgi:hypothetical protein
VQPAAGSPGQAGCPSRWQNGFFQQFSKFQSFCAGGLEQLTQLRAWYLGLEDMRSQFLLEVLA